MGAVQAQYSQQAQQGASRATPKASGNAVGVSLQGKGEGSADSEQMTA